MCDADVTTSIHLPAIAWFLHFLRETNVQESKVRNVMAAIAKDLGILTR